ncbi:MAG: hypothetical protein COX77_05010 [Candidatus Komeilibacteria bacterium CG_4_10_14_0_2_um_filter_37_10]|uniref:Uncharacterized protein n=1 Tax=Candidatus Komeilibacteria bacterium CG_4_10_14_0_2_um_filter_37_10 TaxID=1974470 RepID=A0A2M7VD66_9BACT|nr:MAG: hypothetical protein COX77_05010 [Candidatus Komeilibacteria bacterium CG_4_10_14_0_2_um_filter_37_10]PJA92563.1 MAG: hypothetical protein CO133_02520 [Candidatus Komeilibacteria bacterium CG_4_9_14_3_um_filter_37_5]
MKEKINVGIVAFSFGYQIDNPGPSNKVLASVVQSTIRQINHSNDQQLVAVVLQHEINSCFQKSPATLVVTRHTRPRQYLNSGEVVSQADGHFSTRKVELVYVIAQPFLHLSKCKKLVRFAGYELAKYKFAKVPFDPHSVQWWTRSKWQLLIYALLQKIVGWKGNK